MSDRNELSRKGISPSAFMRELRPELYSDSAGRTTYQLDAATLEYHLETITSRNETHSFEIFCRKLCERTICPNLLPATGPEGGGDSKADTETILVADEIATLTYVGETNAGQERWAFAFSANKKWRDKVRGDVAGIVATGRPYRRIYCVTSRFARARDRARLADELSSRYGLPTIILDRQWIVEQVIDGDRRDLAFNYLGVGHEVVDARRLGPSDYSRDQQLADIEKAIGNPQAFTGMEMQLVTEAIVAAKLSRSLERPRIETDGRFERAIRLAEKCGTYRQRLEATYERLWTGFWWFDDIALVNSSYDSFESLAFATDHALNLELLCNLAQLLFNCVIHKHLTADESKLEARVGRLCERLQRLSEDAERPNNALAALTSLQVIRVNQAWIEGNREALGSLWPGFSVIVERARGLGEYDAERLVKMIDVFGNIAGNDAGYTQLVEDVAAFVSERTSEAEGALVLLKRAKQLDLDDKLEMIRLLGKTVRQLTKKEYTDSLIEATQLLSLAYRSAGLLWAARAASIFAIASIFIQAEEDSDVPVSVVPALVVLGWIALELCHLPDLLEAIRLLRGCAKGLPLDDASKERVAERLSELDLMLASRLLNLEPAELEPLSRLPDVLAGLACYQSRTSLLYALGHEGLLREDGSIPPEETAEKVDELLSMIAGQCQSNWQRIVVFNESDRQQVYVSTVLGMKVKVCHGASETSILVAEAVIGAIEALFATTLDFEALPHTESFMITVRETSDIAPAFTLDREAMTANLNWPAERSPSAYSEQPELQKVLVHLAASVFTATCYVKDMDATLRRFLDDEAVIDRITMIIVVGNSRHRVFKSSVSRLSDWTKLAATTYQAQSVRPSIVPRKSERAGEKAANSDHSDAEVPFERHDHRDFGVRSIVDVHLWNSAGWTGTAFAHWGPPYPPAIALLFTNGEAAKKIFERWRERFGEVDELDDIHLAVVRGISAENPAHYRVLVTSRLPAEDDLTGPGMMVAARIQTMQPQSDINLTNFLAVYERSNAYFLVPAVWKGRGEPEFLLRHGIRKRKLTVKWASEISEHDLEALALKAT